MTLTDKYISTLTLIGSYKKEGMELSFYYKDNNWLLTFRKVDDTCVKNYHITFTPINGEKWNVIVYRNLKNE